MALAWTWTTLVEALRAWPVEQDNDDYENALPTLVGLGEIRLIKDLNLDIFDVIDDTLTLSAGDRFVAKPTGWVATRALRVGIALGAATTSATALADAICLEQVVPHDLDDMNIDGADAGVTYDPPRRLTVTETTENAGGLEVIITGTDGDGFPVSETLRTLGKGKTAFSLTLFSSVTGVQGRHGDGTRKVTVGRAVAPGSIQIGETWPLELRSKGYCQAYAPDLRATGRPRFYNEHSATQWEVVDAADQDYVVISHHVQRPQGLSSSSPNSTTWLSSAVPDCLFAACLMEAEQYLKADDRYSDFRNKYYQELLPAARLELRNLIRLGDRGPFQGAARAAG